MLSIPYNNHGFGCNSIQWTQILYSASTRINELISKLKSKQNQGTSGLLFNLTIELLAEKMRSENNIKGKTIGGISNMKNGCTVT